MKTTRLDLVLQAVLESICKDVIADNFEVTSSTAEIIYNTDVIGIVKYYVSINIISKGSYGDYNNPPEKEEVDVILESAVVDVIYSENGRELKNITDYLNKMLVKNEGKNLDYEL